MSNQRNEQQIFTATKNGNYEQLQLLLKEEKDIVNIINIQDTKNNETLLHKACSYKNNNNSEEEKKEGGGIKNNYLQVVELLLAHGANVNSKERWGHKPLHLAFQSGQNMDIIKLLLFNKNATINNEDFIYACAYGHVDAVMFMIENNDVVIDVDGKNEDGDTPLFVASKMGRVNVAKILLEHNANVQGKTELGRTPLFGCCEDEDEHVDVAKVLIEANADVHIEDNEGYTALHEACCKGHVNIVKLLLAHDADVNHENNLQETPLYTALHYAPPGYQEIVKLLIENNASVNVQENDQDYTALHKASEIGCVNCVKLLLRSGADMTLENSDGYTAENLAAGETLDCFYNFIHMRRESFRWSKRRRMR